MAIFWPESIQNIAVLLITVCDHPGGQIPLFWQKMTQNKGVSLITPKITPLDDTNELYYWI